MVQTLVGIVMSQISETDHAELLAAFDAVCDRWASEWTAVKSASDAMEMQLGAAQLRDTLSKRFSKVRTTRRVRAVCRVRVADPRGAFERRLPRICKLGWRPSARRWPSWCAWHCAVRAARHSNGATRRTIWSRCLCCRSR